ncbi:MAG: hypothetical protein OEZ22_01490 [Spirochaetia bacterium]|nr:hypothetical protein [Spirochaetia bacterium]
MKSKNLKVVIFFILVFFSGVIIFYLDNEHNRFSDRKIKNSIVTGYEIISAVKRYHKEKGEFPRSLDELMPEYISKIKNPQAGEKEWKYIKKNDSFYLGIMRKNLSEPHCYYSLVLNEWLVELPQ